MAMPGRIELDKIDRAILRILSHDGRISMTDLGARVGLSKTPVTARVRRLEAEGVITGYRADLSARRLGMDHVAFLEVRLSDTRETALQAFNAAVREIPEVEECHMIAGGFDYLVKVRTQDIGEYRRVLSESVSRLPHVASTSTYVSMESVRDPGVQRL
ncbi:MAG: Lrp/AsnC ligand binding domain-containing protein [Roseivivax sp.]|nr:Lrp/AsnC ligand binding domain-containing protein [Roseivivax sp.]